MPRENKATFAPYLFWDSMTICELLLGRADSIVKAVYRAVKCMLLCIEMSTYAYIQIGKVDCFLIRKDSVASLKSNVGKIFNVCHQFWKTCVASPLFSTTYSSSGRILILCLFPITTAPPPPIKIQ